MLIHVKKRVWGRVFQEKSKTSYKLLRVWGDFKGISKAK
jgi:hypothetical protein